MAGERAMGMSSQGALKNVAVSVDETREKSYAWENGNIRGYNGLGAYIPLINREDTPII
jgi:hypothetical protein